MQINLSSSAQRIISGTHPLRPLHLRNVPQRLDHGQAEDYLRRHGIPCIEQPDEFVSRLVDLEPRLGTARTALVGLISTDTSVNKESHILGLRHFDEISARIPELTGDAKARLCSLYEFLSPDLKFTTKADIFHALAALKGNLGKHAVLSVGNCVVCASLFSFLAMERQFVAGELRKLGSFHSLSYILVDDVEIVYHREQGSGFKRFLNDIYEDKEEKIKPDNVIIGSAFSFISSLLLSQVNMVMRKQKFEQLQFSQNVFDELLAKLVCAEEINPFSERVYAGLSQVHWQLRHELEAFDAKVKLNALSELLLQGGKPAIML